MRLGFATGHDFVAHFFGKRDINQLIPVHMTDLPAPHAIFSAPKRMRPGLDSRPGHHRLGDPLCRADSSRWVCFDSYGHAWLTALALARLTSRV